jgi:hypothetical protein
LAATAAATLTLRLSLIVVLARTTAASATVPASIAIHAVSIIPVTAIVPIVARPTVIAIVSVAPIVAITAIAIGILRVLRRLLALILIRNVRPVFRRRRHGRSRRRRRFGRLLSLGARHWFGRCPLVSRDSSGVDLTSAAGITFLAVRIVAGFSAGTAVRTWTTSAPRRASTFVHALVG